MPRFSQPRAQARSASASKMPLGGSHLDTFNGGYRYVTIGDKTFEACEVVSLVLDNLVPLDKPGRERRASLDATIDMEHGEPVSKPARRLATFLEI